MLNYYESMSVSVSKYEPKPEYRLIYHWDAEHWTCITTGDPVDIHQYIKNNLVEMQDGMEVSEDAYFSIEYYFHKVPMNIWQGTPEELLEISKEITDNWLDKAFT